MPLKKLQFRPGVNREGTNYSNEGGFYQCDKVRFRSGYPEKLGGWQSVSNPSVYTYKGVGRTMWNWIALDGSNLNAIGTNQKLYVENGGNYNDITPYATASPTALANNPITTTSGSKQVTITASGHGRTAGTYVTFAGATAVGGLTIVGAYEIVTVPDGNIYTIISTTAASSGATGGGAGVTAHYQINAGLATYTQGVGWGAGPWNGVVTTAVSTTLSSALSSVATSISVASTGSFSASGTILIEAEIITYAGTSGGNTFTGCTRGTSGSTATAHLSGITVTQATGTSGSVGWGQAASVGVGQQLRLWTLDTFGQDLLAAPRNSVIYYWVKDTSSYAPAVTLKSLASTAGYSSGTFVPTQTLQVFVSPLQRFVIAMGSNPYDPGESGSPTTFDPMLVRWADQENPYDWVPSSTNQSGEQRLSNGSTIVTCLHGRQENLIFTDTALFVMQYLGPPYVWGFNMIEGNLSIISPAAAVTANNVTYWMGMDKFSSYSGTVAPIPCTLRQFIFGNINQSQAYQVVSGSNEGFNEVWWHYPSAGSQVNDSYVIYNYLEKLWYYGSMNRTAWLDSALRSYPMAAFSVQNSYLSVAVTSTTATSVSLIDTSSYPYAGSVQIDSEVITYTGNSGNTLTGCTRGVLGTTAATHTQYTAVSNYVQNQVMFHELGVDDGSLPVPVAMESSLQSSDFDIGDGDHFAFVWRMLPDVTFNGSTVNDPQLFMQLKPRQNSGTAYNTTTVDTVVSANNFDPTTGARYYTIETYTGQVYTRLRGRQMAYKIYSTGVGVNWQLGVPRLDIRPDGRR
jgi:hypothetical protein